MVQGPPMAPPADMQHNVIRVDAAEEVPQVDTKAPLRGEAEVCRIAGEGEVGADDNRAEPAG